MKSYWWSFDSSTFKRRNDFHLTSLLKLLLEINNDDIHLCDCITIDRTITS